MTTSGTELTPIGSGPGIDHWDSLSTPQNLAQASRATPPFRAGAKSGLTVVPNLVFDKLKPTVAINRYERSVKVKELSLNGTILSPLTTSFDDKKPRDWAPLVHPEGALYWVYEPQGDQEAMPIYTDAHLRNEGIFEEIEKFREAILGEVHDRANKMPDKWELVLELADNEGPDERVCYYYFVNCSNRSLFWLHEFDVAPFLHNLPQVEPKSNQRIQQGLEIYYWGHWEMFPHNREVPERLLNELMGIMIHARLDDMTSEGSTSIYPGDELQTFAQCVKEIKRVGGDGGYSACVVGRLMKSFTHGRYINFFGQREARLSTDQSIFTGIDRKKRTWLIKTMSFLMFYGPEVQLEALDSVYTDFVTCKHKWTKFVGEVQNEWRELSWTASILLASNVAFLAIPSVDNSPNNGGKYVRTPAQVTSFISTIFSLGCLLVGQLLLRHYTIRPRDSAEEVDKYLRSYHDEHRGLEILAILYSLPYSLLLWAIVSFFVAFTFFTFVETMGKWQRYPSVVVTSILIALLIWCIWATWEGRVEFVARVWRFLGCSQAHRQLQLDGDQPEQCNDQGIPPFQSVGLHPNPRSG